MIPVCLCNVEVIMRNISFQSVESPYK